MFAVRHPRREPGLGLFRTAGPRIGLRFIVLVILVTLAAMVLVA